MAGGGVKFTFYLCRVTSLKLQSIYTIYARIKIQYVPHREHSVLLSERPVREYCARKYTLYFVRTIRNTSIRCGENKEIFALNRVVNILTTMF